MLLQKNDKWSPMNYLPSGSTSSQENQPVNVEIEASKNKSTLGNYLIK